MPGQIMGVLNVTPDSFFDGGRWLDHNEAVAHGIDLISQGADIIDIGGESTRPHAEPVGIAEELARVIPVIERLAPLSRVSIDTRHAEVAVAAVNAGATLINDVSASLFQVSADMGVGWVAMHMQGTPETMQTKPTYGDVVKEVAEFLFAKAGQAKSAGVSEVWIDPGIGFGKTTEHNLEILRNIEVFAAAGYPVVIGTSRKSFLGVIAGDANSTPPQDRLEASVVTAAFALEHGASMVRVHDVEATAKAARVIAALGQTKQSQLDVNALIETKAMSGASA